MKPIQVENLEKSFDEKTVLQNLSLEVSGGEVCGLLGRNGVGKSTLIKCIIGLHRPQNGRVCLLGQDTRGDATAARLQTVYVCEGELLPPSADIRKIIAFESASRSVFHEDGIRTWLDSEGIKLGKKISTLSKGQKKRLEFELALASKPKVLLLDEPFSGLDPVARTEVMEKLIAVAYENESAVLISSHILTDLERLCGHVALLAKGRIALTLEMDELKESVAIVNTEIDGLELIPPEMKRLSIRKNGDEATLVLSGANDANLSQLADLGFHFSRPSLDELGVEMMRGHK